MKLYMQQRIFTWGDKFFIYNETGKITADALDLLAGQDVHIAAEDFS